MNTQLLFIDETAEVGGAQKNLCLLAAALQTQGWDILVVLPNEGALSQRLAMDGIPVEIIPGAPRFSVSFYLKKAKLPNPIALALNFMQGVLWGVRLWRLMRKHPQRLVHTNSMWAHAFGGLAARLAGLPVVIHFQDIVERNSGFGLFHKLLVLWAHWVPNRIVCISSLVTAQFLQQPGLADKVQLIWNTVDLARYQSGQSQAADHLRIATVARITPWKGQHLALQVAKQLRTLEIPFRWYMVGTPSLGSAAYHQQLIDQTQAWGLGDQVLFTGWVEDMPELYRAIDVLVHLPIEPEPFGLVLAEAMAAGIPVIAAVGGGADGFVQAGGGQLVALDEIDTVGELLACWWKNPLERQRRSATARGYADEVFGMDRYVDAWKSAFAAISGENE